MIKKLKKRLIRWLEDRSWIEKSGLKYSKLSQKINIILLYQRVVDIQGSVVECGVAKGNGLIYLKMLIEEEGKNRKLYGLDTFQGLPSPREGERGKIGEFGASKEEVVENFRDNNIPLTNIELIEGDIKDTWKNVNEPIAFLHIDVDLYQSTKEALNLWDKVSKGGVVLFDDYDVSGYHQTAAVDEFVKEHHLNLLKSEFSGKYYLIK